MTTYAVFDTDGFLIALYASEIFGLRERPVFGELVTIEIENSDGDDHNLMADPSVSPNPPIVGYEPNPDCHVPVEAVEITDDQYRELIGNQGLRRWIDGEVVAYEPPGPTPEELAAAARLEIKAEARRRILLIMTEDQQRNTLAAGQAAVMQYGSNPVDWPAELQERQLSAMAAWAEIERLRARSNEIEQMDPIPTDMSDDHLWSLEN